MKRLQIIILLVSVLGASQLTFAQILKNKQEFTRQDSLRGSITPERAWWDLVRYDLDVKIEPDKKFISGSNTITYSVLAPYQVMQIDLQEPMQILQVLQDNKELNVRHEGNAHYVELLKDQEIGAINKLQVFYEGYPLEAANAPWDGGFSWKKDANGNHFIATSCQGLGASVWWPNKDHMYQEVDGMTIAINVPLGLTAVANGRLTDQQAKEDGTKTFVWLVENPINNYGVNVNIGKYAHFSEVYEGENGALDMDYYVLEDHLDKAKTQFKDATKMMEAFEHWFGPYPFYEDSFKLVEVPYLGMEHQSSITYGNQYKNGYLGTDLSGTGWGLKFDFIIIHESGHEWFANNITNKDIADMWIHESFTAYSESLFLDYHYGRNAAAEYVIGTRKRIINDKPIIGVYGVNQSGSGDMYYKGSNMLHTLRQIVDNDTKWRLILRGLNKEFYHQTVTTQQIEGYLSQQIGINLDSFFDQYLRDTRIPTLEYAIKKNKMYYRWTDVVDGFEMPLQIVIDGSSIWITPTTKTQKLKFANKKAAFEPVDDFLVEYRMKSKLK